MSGLPISFTARLRKSDAKGGWTYVVWPESAASFGTLAVEILERVR